MFRTIPVDFQKRQFRHVCDEEHNAGLNTLEQKIAKLRQSWAVLLTAAEHLNLPPCLAKIVFPATGLPCRIEL